MDKLLSSFILGMALIAVSGCASTPIAAARKAGIKTVLAEPKIECKTELLRTNPSRSAASAVDSLSQTLGISRARQAADKIEALMQTNQVRIPNLVSTYAAVRIRQYHDLQLTKSDSDGVFVVHILQYGLYRADPRPKQVPFIFLRAELLDRNGKRVWSRKTSFKELQIEGIGASWEEYIAHPEMIEADWKMQIENVVSWLFLPE